MLRDKTGKKLSLMQIQNLIKGLEDLYENNFYEDVKLRDSFNSSSLPVIVNFIFCIQKYNDYDNKIFKLYDNILNQSYFQANKDPDQKDKSKIEKDLITHTKKRVINGLIKKEVGDKGATNKILFNAFRRGNTEVIDYEFFHKFRNKHKNFVQKFLAKLTSRASHFRRTKFAQNLKTKLYKRYGEENIDFNSLSKFLVVTNLIDSTEKNIYLLYNLFEVTFRNKDNLKKDDAKNRLILEQENKIKELEQQLLKMSYRD